MTSTQPLTRNDKAVTPAIDTMDITVLAGGPGLERNVSLESGRAVHEALTRLGHRSVLCDIGPDDLSALARPTDFVFIALHGEFGEDGTVQHELEARGLPYSGCGEAASRVAMDKVASKRLIQDAGIPTPAFEVVDRDGLAGLAERFATPAVVKPVASGSSVDTSIVRSPEELPTAVSVLIERYGQALVERFIAGPELTVGILGDATLPVCEIRPQREFYDYQAKYEDDDTQYLFDFDLPDDLIRRVESLSLAAHRALGCRVLSRVDWMVDGATLEPYFLEVNTIPGFTSHSLVPKAAARIGLDFEQLCQRIVELSLAEMGAA